MKPQHALVGYLGLVAAVFICVAYILPIATIWTLIGFICAFLVVLGLLIRYFRKVL